MYRRTNLVEAQADQRERQQARIHQRKKEKDPPRPDDAMVQLKIALRCARSRKVRSVAHRGKQETTTMSITHLKMKDLTRAMTMPKKTSRLLPSRGVSCPLVAWGLPVLLCMELKLLHDKEAVVELSRPKYPNDPTWH